MPILPMLSQMLGSLHSEEALSDRAVPEKVFCISLTGPDTQQDTSALHFF